MTARTRERVRAAMLPTRRATRYRADDADYGRSPLDPTREETWRSEDDERRSYLASPLVRALLEYIDAALAEGPHVSHKRPDSVTLTLTRIFDAAHLTPQERRAMELRLAGFQPAQVAEFMDVRRPSATGRIKAATVRQYVYRATVKLTGLQEAV